MSNEILIRCCAPTMACLKTGNMFNCVFSRREQMTEELRRLNQRLGRKGLRILPLRWRNVKALLYLYRPRMLERDLRDPLARKASAQVCRAHLNEIKCESCPSLQHHKDYDSSVSRSILSVPDFYSIFPGHNPRNAA